MNESCCGVAGLLFGHNFKGRYDHNETVPADSAQCLERSIRSITDKKLMVVDGDVDALREIQAAFSHTVAEDSFYVQDVCGRCGLVVERVEEDLSNRHPQELIEAAIRSMEDFEATKEELDELDQTADKLDRTIIAAQDALPVWELVADREDLSNAKAKDAT